MEHEPKPEHYIIVEEKDMNLIVIQPGQCVGWLFLLLNAKLI